jgi:hypothetical protein
MNIQCENCEHGQVCAHKEKYKEYFGKVGDFSANIEIPFKVSMNCVYYRPHSMTPRGIGPWSVQLCGGGGIVE